jgi:hypothetical protein
MFTRPLILLLFILIFGTGLNKINKIKKKKILFLKLVKSQLRCTFDRPLLGEYYSYENGLEAHSSFRDNGDIERLFYRRQSGLGATASVITILDNFALGECFNLNWRENPFEHSSKHHYELIYRDKLVLLFNK